MKVQVGQVGYTVPGKAVCSEMRRKTMLPKRVILVSG